jgi:hypothetical protein
MCGLSRGWTVSSSPFFIFVQSVRAREHLQTEVSDVVKMDRRQKLSAQILFFISGVLSMLGFLIRVIPKPGRATLPLHAGRCADHVRLLRIYIGDSGDSS